MGTVLLYGFAAAALGGFDSIKGAVVGGLIVGLAEALLPNLFTFIGCRAEPGDGARDHPRRADGAATGPVRHRSGRCGSEHAARSPSSRALPAHRATQLVGYGLIARRPCCSWSHGQPDFQLVNLSKVAAYAVAVLGLNLVTGFSGQVSLGHSAFFGIGAYTTAILFTD